MKSTYLYLNDNLTIAEKDWAKTHLSSYINNNFAQLFDNFNIIILFPDILKKYDYVKSFIEYVIKKQEEVKKQEKVSKPYLILSSLSDLLNPVEQKKSEDLINETIRKYPFTSFIFNSSIWFYYADMSFGSESKLNVEYLYQELSLVCHRYKTISELNLNGEPIYKYPNAIEYLDFHLRLQKENYLADIEGSHARNIEVLPIL